MRAAPLLLLRVGEDAVGVVELGPLVGLVWGHVRVAGPRRLPKRRLDVFLARTPRDPQVFVVVRFLIHQGQCDRKRAIEIRRSSDGFHASRSGA
jgi:hypothetical protein